NEPDGGASLNFDFPIDLNQSPSTYQDAAVVNLFYWNNLLHDLHYEYGFDEVSGNFQENNYGNGGSGNDWVRAEAQDGSGVNNANMLTLPDGNPPRMQMYLGDRATPNRDGDLDNLVIIHEYGHGVSQRLTGGPATTGCLGSSQSRGMGEGWSDWWGLVYTAKATDTESDPRTVGTWLFGQAPTGPGIRPHPYTTDLIVNPHTYADISTAVQPHGVGSIWCAMLWEVYWALVNQHGFDPDFHNGTMGNNIAMQLIMDGLKLQPCNPSFTDARDAILMADRINYGGANRTRLWQAFAKRGLGFSAYDGGSAGTVNVTEAFDLPDDLSIAPGLGFLATGAEGGPFTPNAMVYEVANTGSNPVNWSVSGAEAWFDLSSPGGLLAPGATASVSVALNPAADALLPGTYQGTVVFSNSASGIFQDRAVQLRVETFANLPFYDGFESGGLQTFWRAGGSGPFNSTVTTLHNPPAGLHHLTMQSGQSSTYARNEVTLGLNLLGYTNVFLSFFARDYSDEAHGPPPTPFTDGADFDGVAVSEDGLLWYEVQDLRTSIGDTYHQIHVDLDQAVAAAGIQYNETFRIRFNQYDNFSITTDGIGIDEISVTGRIDRVVRLNLPLNLNEAAGVLANAGTVTLSEAAASTLLVALQSSDTSEVTVPPTLTFPPGITSQTFNVTVIDDNLLDGTQPVDITATIDGGQWRAGEKTIAVDDNETATLTVSLPAEATEGDQVGPVIGTIGANRAPDDPVDVQLTFDDASELNAPAVITLPAGQASVDFVIDIIDDGLIDFAQVVNLSVSVPNWTGASTSLTVNDNESLDLSVTLPADLEESQGLRSAAGRVSFAGILTANQSVDLSSSDPGAITITPSTVVVTTG
ncbi:MAG: M36 family metallopeptidase, partial [Verrucomicrobiota bacterium]